MSIRCSRIALRIRPGGPAGRMRPETQTLESTTTRSAGPSHLAHRFHHVLVYVLLGKAFFLGDPGSALEEGGEAALPLIVRDAADTLGREPLVDRFTHESGDGLPAALAQAAQRLELLVVEVDVGSSHRPYIIPHHCAPLAHELAEEMDSRQ
jgi:hypothetical protein